MSKSFNLNSLNLASAFRPKDKKLSSKDLKNLPIYIFGYDKEKSFTPRINPGEYSILLGACTYYGMSNLYPISNDVLDEGQEVRDSHNSYKVIKDYDKVNFINCTSKGWFVPTEARCIIDCIRYRNLVNNNDQFLYAIEDYFDLGRTLEELYEVSDFYNVNREIVNYWINESSNYCGVNV